MSQRCIENVAKANLIPQPIFLFLSEFTILFVFSFFLFLILSSPRRMEFLSVLSEYLTFLLLEALFTQVDKHIVIGQQPS